MKKKAERNKINLLIRKNNAYMAKMKKIKPEGKFHNF